MKKIIAIAVLLVLSVGVLVGAGAQIRADAISSIVPFSYHPYTYPNTPGVPYTVSPIHGPGTASQVRGDANLDRKVLANDARIVLRASASLYSLTGQGFINCDLNGDGKLLAGEARKILRFSAHLEATL